MPWMVFVILLTLLDKLSSEVACIRLADIYWNITNPIFRIDNTDHIIDVNKGNGPFEYDQVNIICPVYPHHGTDPESQEDAETYIIYNVSKEEYDSCRITNPNPRIIAVCNKPNQLMYFTVTFRSFTPQPGGLEFLPGHDYYFVSTSTGEYDGLHNMVGGRCATHNMKVTFKVCCSSDKVSPSSDNRSNEPIPDVPDSASHSPAVTEEADSFFVSSTRQPEDKPYHKNLLYPTRHNANPFINAITARPTTFEGSHPTTTPRSMRRPFFPSRVTPLTKQRLPYDEMPIEDEMARPHENLDDHLPNKSRSKNQEMITGDKSDSISSSSCWTSCRNNLHRNKYMFCSASVVSQLLLTLFWS